MLTFIIVFFHFRCLAKNGSVVVQMEPLEASWLVRACVVLHNMCIDWGLQALKPEDSYDPEIELDIQQEAAKRFLWSLKQNRDRSVLEVRRRKQDKGGVPGWSVSAQRHLPQSFSWTPTTGSGISGP